MNSNSLDNNKIGISSNKVFSKFKPIESDSDYRINENYLNNWIDRTTEETEAMNCLLNYSQN